MAEKLRIAETFLSLQGEGILTGVPSFFIRVSGCNLRCTWCDTPYASWSPEGPFMDVAELAQRAKESGVAHVVLTGGEPMLFDAIEGLTSSIAAQGQHITIETAGTVYREVRCDLMSISPKLSNSTPTDPNWGPKHDATRQQPDVVAQLMANYNFQLKFVLSDIQDADEIKLLMAKLPTCAPDKIVVMPEGVSGAELEIAERNLVPIALREGWRLSGRRHISWFGNKRGT